MAETLSLVMKKILDACRRQQREPCISSETLDRWIAMAQETERELERYKRAYVDSQRTGGRIGRVR